MVPVESNWCEAVWYEAFPQRNKARKSFYVYPFAFTSNKSSFEKLSAAKFSNWIWERIFRENDIAVVQRSWQWKPLCNVLYGLLMCHSRSEHFPSRSIINYAYMCIFQRTIIECLLVSVGTSAVDNDDDDVVYDDTTTTTKKQQNMNSDAPMMYRLRSRKEW